MTLYNKAGNFVDELVSIFSPRAGAERRMIRMGRSYAAAQSNRMTGTWSPSNQTINDILQASTSQVRARVRQLVRDFPYFGRALNILVDYTVGQGIFYQSRISDATGKLNKPAIQAAEDAFNFWADEADITGRLHFYELMRLAKRQDIESGEFLFIKHLLKDKPRYIPFALQAVESDWLTDSGANVSSENDIKSGVEYNKATGQIKFYHFTDPNGWGKTIKVEAERVLHGFETLRPGQLTGVSPFVAGVLVSRDLSDFIDATLDQAKLAAKYLAFVTTDRPSNWQLGLGTYENQDGTTERTMDMENAIVEFLRPNETVNFAANPHPGETFTPFVKFVLTMLSVSTGAPYELISGDYSGMNYTTMRTVRNDFAFQLKPISTRHVRQFAMPCLKTFFDTAVMSGKLNFPAYFQNPSLWLKSEWQPPGMSPVDPLKESKSNIDEITAGLKSPYEVVKARGRDLEDVYKEIKQAKELAEHFGLEFGEVSTALANSPSVIMDDNGRSKQIFDLQAQLIELVDALDNVQGRA